MNFYTNEHLHSRCRIGDKKKYKYLWGIHKCPFKQSPAKRKQPNKLLEKENTGWKTTSWKHAKQLFLRYLNGNIKNQFKLMTKHGHNICERKLLGATLDSTSYHSEGQPCSKYTPPTPRKKEEKKLFPQYRRKIPHSRKKRTPLRGEEKNELGMGGYSGVRPEQINKWNCNLHLPSGYGKQHKIILHKF